MDPGGESEGEQADFLMDLGCWMVQEILLSGPIPGKSFATLLSEETTAIPVAYPADLLARS